MTLLTDRWVAAVIVLIAAALLAAALITWWVRREKERQTELLDGLHNRDRGDKDE